MPIYYVLVPKEISLLFSCIFYKYSLSQIVEDPEPTHNLQREADFQMKGVWFVSAL